MNTESQSARVLAVLKDGKAHSVPEIHQKAGTMRLNSRIADLRKKGHVIVCERRKGIKGAAAYYYTLVGDAVGQLRLNTDMIAPRTKSERYRIFRVKNGGEPEIMATARTQGGVGTALCRMGAEGEFEDYVVGVQDARDHKDKHGNWVGKWLIKPWVEKVKTT